MSGGNGKQLCSCQCHWDMSWLRFGDSKIAVSDVDGLFVVERKKHFLFIETKGPEERLSDGQNILLTNLSHVPRFKVLVVRGRKGYPERVAVLSHGEIDIHESSREEFQRRVDQWYEYANLAKDPKW